MCRCYIPIVVFREMNNPQVIFLLLHWQEATQSAWNWYDYPWPWVSLTWLLYNLQLWRHGHWFRKFTVRCCCCNNFISPRPSELTPVQLLIDISCHLISPHFSFAHSSCLSYPPSHPPKKSGPCLSPFSLLFRKMPKLIHWLLVFCVKMLGKGHQGIIFCKDNPIFLRQLRSKIIDP